jgi:hypothetical protein
MRAHVIPDPSKRRTYRRVGARSAIRGSTTLCDQSFDAASVATLCRATSFGAPFDLGDKLAKRTADFDRRLAELPDDAFGWFSKQGWVDSAWEQVDFCR